MSHAGAASMRGREVLAGAARVLVFTGAGVSAESGVPTFRGPDGLWQRYRAEDLATPEAFARDPRLVWEWYGWRRERVASCRPNDAHLAIAEFVTRHAGVTLVTQNVDDLHERAASQIGAASSPPIRLHGSLFHSRCTVCGDRVEDRAPVDAGSLSSLPRCAKCGALLRPDVVWFGEELPRDAFLAAFLAASASDACVVVGTSGAVHPAAGVVHAARAASASVVVVDTGDTAFDGIADVRVREPAARALPELLGNP